VSLLYYEPSVFNYTCRERKSYSYIYRERKSNNTGGALRRKESGPQGWPRSEDKNRDFTLIHAHADTYIYVSISIYLYRYLYIYIYIYIYICTHTHTHTHTHIHKKYIENTGEASRRRGSVCMYTYTHKKKNRNTMNEARLSHLPFWGPSEAFYFLIKRPSG